MPTITQDLYEEITNELRNLKTDKEEDQIINNILLKKIHCLGYGVYNNIIDINFLNNVEVIKQYRQSVMNSENADFFVSVIRKLQILKIMTMVIVYEINQGICMRVIAYDLFLNFK